MNRQQWNDFVARAAKPANRHAWQDAQTLRLRAQFATETDVVDGALAWKSNGSVIAPCTFKDAQLDTPAEQQAAYNAQHDAFLASYRANLTYSDEQRAEILREVGPNAVNALTGERV